jgi:hypothetical protein
MEIIKELTYVVNKNKVKSINMKDLYLDSESKLSALYHAVVDNTCNTDEEALQLIYPDAKDTGKYRYLKSKLKKRLLNYLFFIDLELPSFTDRQKAYLKCHKEWAMVGILSGRGAKNASLDVAKGLLKEAIRFEFNEIVMDIARILRFHYGVIMMDTRKHKKYRDMYRKYERYYVNENRIEEAYVEIILMNHKKRLSKEGLSELIREEYNSIEGLVKETPTYKAQLYAYLMQVMLYSSEYKTEEMIVACQEAIAFFEAKAYQANTPLQIFYYQQLIGYSQIRMFEEGRAIAEKCFSFLEVGTFNWFRYMESYFILAMHTGKYKEAYTIFEEVIENNRFNAMPKEVREIWKIYEAYLFFVFNIQEEEAELEEVAPKLSKFRLGRFLNEIPSYSKEKRGMNIAILIIQILIYIQKKSYNPAIDRIEAIEKYATRYLKDKETLRSYYFIKMLLAIPTHSFHIKAVLRHTSKLHKKLESLPLEVVDQDHKIEVIPYEHLWELSLKLMDSKFVVVKQ